MMLTALMVCTLCLVKRIENAAFGVQTAIMSIRSSFLDRKHASNASPSITHAYSPPSLERRNAMQRTKQATHRSPKSAAKTCIGVKALLGHRWFKAMWLVGALSSPATASGKLRLVLFLPSPRTHFAVCMHLRGKSRPHDALVLPTRRTRPWGGPCTTMATLTDRIQ